MQSDLLDTFSGTLQNFGGIHDSISNNNNEGQLFCSGLCESSVLRYLLCARLRILGRKHQRRHVVRVWTLPPKSSPTHAVSRRQSQFT